MTASAEVAEKSAATEMPETVGKLAKIEAAPIKVRPEPKPDNGPQGYEGASTGTTTKEEDAALMAPFAEDQYDIKSTEAGEVFVAQVHVRRRLNEVFGALGWALIPIPTEDGRLFYRDGKGDQESVQMRGRLYVRGHFRSDHVGEQALSHSRMSYATACEAAQSDTLTRCAKDLSIGWECWDKRWCERWREKYAVRVMVKKGQETKTLWRRKDGDPLKGEIPMTSGQELKEKAQAKKGATVEPLISKNEVADLWAVATETFTRQRAEAMLRDIIARYGFHATADVTKAKLPAILADIRKAGE